MSKHGPILMDLARRQYWCGHMAGYPPIMTAEQLEQRPSSQAMDCDKCHGKGKVHKPIKAGDFAVNALVTCPDCHGTGRHQYRAER